MDLKESQVSGAMLIAHKIHEGKHQYEVENVVKFKKGSGDKSFARKGDKLMCINSNSLDDVTPEELGEMLTKESPQLTVHAMKDHQKEPVQTEGAFYPVSKESTILSFYMEMRLKEDLEGSEGGSESGSNDNEGIKEGVCNTAATEENSENADFVIISMKKTSISVVKGRGSIETGYSVNEVVLVAQSSKVTLVSRGSESFQQEKSMNAMIEHVASQYYLTSLCSQKTISASADPEKITIYSYKSNELHEEYRGMPVVLNFTESNCFLKCCKKDQRVFLQVETCEKRQLRRISKSDESTLSFVFYMKSDRNKQRTFESVLYQGWFIHVVNPDRVEMANLEEEREGYSFLFVIQK